MAAQQALMKAEGLVAIERWQDAMAALGPALADDATAGRAFCVQARCQLGLDKPKAAAVSAERAAAAEPELEWPHRLLAIAALARGKSRQARKHALEAVRLAPGTPDALYVLGKTQLALNKKRDARASADAAMRANPHAPVSQLIAGEVSEAERDLPAAEAHYREGLRLDPQESELALRLADVLKKQGRREDASQVYLAAAAQDPTDSRAREGLSRIGLPILGGGTLLLIKIGVVGGARTAIENLPTPTETAFLLWILLAVGGVLTTAFRVQGTKALPNHIHSGLLAEHRNFALRWLQVAAAGTALIALWCALSSAESGGGGPRAVAFGAVALLSWLVAHQLWIGSKLEFTPMGFRRLIRGGRRGD